MVKWAMNPAYRKRIVRAATVGLETTAGSVRKATRTLWLEVTGFVFLVFAVVGGGAALREYHHYAHGEPVLGKLILAIVFTIMFAWFGVTSFWKSRRS